jgi:hypothetical protein
VENLAFLSKIVVRGLQSYWRWARGLRLVAQACLFDTTGRVGLVNASSGDGWRLPRTGVRRGEALEDALSRLLGDDLGIDIGSRQELFWMYTEVNGALGGQTGLFVVRAWMQTSRKPPTLVFFGLDALPAALDADDAARICQAAEGRAPFEVC